jgi:hypothetical protein
MDIVTWCESFSKRWNIGTVDSLSLSLSLLPSRTNSVSERTNTSSFKQRSHPVPPSPPSLLA